MGLKERSQREAGRCKIIYDFVIYSWHDTSTVWAMCVPQTNWLNHFSAALFLSHRQPSHALTSLTSTTHMHTLSHSLREHKYIKHGNVHRAILYTASKWSVLGTAQRPSWGQFLVLPTNWEPLGPNRCSLKTRRHRRGLKLTHLSLRSNISLQNLLLQLVDTPQEKNQYPQSFWSKTWFTLGLWLCNSRNLSLY